MISSSFSSNNYPYPSSDDSPSPTNDDSPSTNATIHQFGMEECEKGRGGRVSGSTDINRSIEKKAYDAMISSIYLKVESSKEISILGGKKRQKKGTMRVIINEIAQKSGFDGTKVKEATIKNRMRKDRNLVTSSHGGFESPMSKI